MKTALTTMLLAFACSCSTPNKVAKGPHALPSQDALWPACPDRPDCALPNGTQSTGLAEGDRAAAIGAVTLTSGETIPLR